MKRLHVHIKVSDLARSIRFYSILFAAGPTIVKDDYAKWMLDDPRVNFALSQDNDGKKGIEHLGIQAETMAELTEVYDRLMLADRPVFEEGQTTCCYAKSEKTWISDPDGTVWEAFLTNDEATIYGDSPALGALYDNFSRDRCGLPGANA